MARSPLVHAGESFQVRTLSHRVVPDGERPRTFAERISASRRPALVYGPEVDRAGGWDAAVALAEKLQAAVYGAPLLDRASFPEDHPLFVGPLGMSAKTISDRLTGHDLVIVIGAEVFRYYPYVPGDYLPAGTEIAAAREAFDRLDGVLISVGGPRPAPRTPSTTSSGVPPSNRSSSERYGSLAP